MCASRYGPRGETTSSSTVRAYRPPRNSLPSPVMRLVDAVSLRSRRRKLRLFLEELRPTAETTVLDVGVD